MQGHFLQYYFNYNSPSVNRGSIPDRDIYCLSKNVNRIIKIIYIISYKIFPKEFLKFDFYRENNSKEFCRHFYIIDFG
jgi:hypothetical protein